MKSEVLSGIMVRIRSICKCIVVGDVSPIMIMVWSYVRLVCGSLGGMVALWQQSAHVR